MIPVQAEPYEPEPGSLSVFMQVEVQTAGIVLLIVRLIICSITQECGAKDGGMKDG